jgi:hypothetical protein
MRIEPLGGTAEDFTDDVTIPTGFLNSRSLGIVILLGSGEKIPNHSG